MAHVAQLVEHVLGKDEVTRSIRVVGSTGCTEDEARVIPPLAPSSFDERDIYTAFLKEDGYGEGEI